MNVKIKVNQIKPTKSLYDKTVGIFLRLCKILLVIGMIYWSASEALHFPSSETKGFDRWGISLVISYVILAELMKDEKK